MATKTKQMNNETEATQSEAGKDESVADQERRQQADKALAPGMAQSVVQSKSSTGESTLQYDPATGAVQTKGEGSKEQKRKELAEQVKDVDPKPETLPPAAAAGVDPGYAEDFRKAKEIATREELAKLKEQQKEEHNSQVQSTASEDQYLKALYEYEERGRDMKLSYNDRFEARQKAEVLRAVINDMKGQGEPSGPTVAKEDRPQR